MISYILRRLAHSALVIIGICVIIFLVIHVLGDPARLMLPLQTSEEDYLAFKHLMGFDDPLYIQFLRFFADAFRGDFGQSWWQRTPALPLVLERIPATLSLVLTAVSVSVLVGVPLGIQAARKLNSLSAKIVRVGSLLGVSIPSFWLGLLLMLTFSVWLRWLPTSGSDGPRNFVLPVLTLSALVAGRLAQMVRTNILEELSRQYVTTAESKGLRRRSILYRHVLKNVSIPVVTMIGWEFTAMLAGSTVIIETVFAWPGLGRLALQAIERRDLPVIMADVFVIALMVTTINLAIDVLYAYLDPRVRY